MLFYMFTLMLSLRLGLAHFEFLSSVNYPSSLFVTSSLSLWVSLPLFFMFPSLCLKAVFLLAQQWWHSFRDRGC